MDVMNLFQNFISWVLQLLPDSPITWANNSAVADLLGYLNYFIPLDFMIASSEAWLTCVILYYTYSAILRWIRAVS